MKRPFLLLPLLAAVGGFALAGCGHDAGAPPTAPGSSGDSQTFDQMMAQEPALADNDTYEAPGDASVPDSWSASGGLSTEAAIQPIFFFRRITDRSRDIHIDYDRDSVKVVANVLVTDRLAGSFNIVTSDTVDTGVVHDIVHKPLRDVGRLRARFVHWLQPPPASGDDDWSSIEGDRGDWSRWHLVAVSNREIASPEHVTQILSIRLQTDSGVDVTVDDPLALMRIPGGIPKFPAGQRILVTVKTADPTDAVFLLAGWGRQRLHKNPDGSWGGSFQAPYDLRRFRLGVNALDHGTLFDDAAPYDSDFWGLLARTVVPTVASN
jgi:hypothetical protein